MDSVTSLYNLVEEEAHVLVQRSNLSLEHLKYLLQLREMESHFLQVTIKTVFKYLNECILLSQYVRFDTFIFYATSLL